LSGWIPESIPVLLQGFPLTTLGGGLDIRTSVGQVFAALMGKNQCCAGIGFKENMQSLSYCIFYKILINFPGTVLKILKMFQNLQLGFNFLHYKVGESGHFVPTLLSIHTLDLLSIMIMIFTKM
jgi:hypothetical protein